MSRISVVIPCYNGQDYLREALSSVQAQTRSAYEIIVVDDGSTDDSVKIARAHGARVVAQNNLGEGAARNAGIRACSGELVASLDADDRWHPHHLATVAGLLDANPDAVGAFGAVQRFGSDTGLVRGCVPPGPPAVMMEEAFREWLHTTISSVVRRDALVDLGGFDEQERSAVDFDLWLRLAKAHKFVATYEVTAEWRMHPAQQSAHQWKQLAAVYRFRRRFIDALHAEDDPRGLHFERLFNRVWVKEVAARLRTREYRSLVTLVGGARMVQPWSALRGNAPAAGGPPAGRAPSA